MVRKKVMGIVLSALIISIILCVYVSAITGSLGNARMILRVNPGDTIERSIRINNVNEIPIKIELFVSGDLTNSTKILDNNFTLNAGESKDARFEMKVKGNGTFSTLINVKFIQDAVSGVGLSSTIIAISSGTTDNTDIEDTSSDNPGTTDTGNTSSDNPGIPSNNSNLKFNLSPIVLAGIVAIALLVVFIVLLMILYNKKSKKVIRKRADRSS